MIKIFFSFVIFQMLLFSFMFRVSANANEEGSPFDLDIITHQTFMRRHKIVLETIIKIDEKTEFSTSGGAEGSFSLFLENLNDMIITPAYSRSGDLCFFAGWPSKKDRRNKCREPWTLKPRKTSYGKACANERTSSGRKRYPRHIRCNPTLFGPGQNGNTKGICVRDNSSRRGISAACKKKSKKNWISQKSSGELKRFYKEKYRPLERRIQRYCGGRSSGLCRTYYSQIAVDKVQEYMASELFSSIGNTIADRTCAAIKTVKDLIKKPGKPADPPFGTKLYQKPQTDKYNDEGLCKNFQKYVKVFKKHGANVDSLKQAFRYFQKHRSKFPNKIITIAEIGSNSRKPRFFKINLTTNSIVPPIYVSHGNGKRGNIRYGDRRHNGNLKRCHFGNRADIKSRENMTRPGFFKTANLYLSPGRCLKKNKKRVCIRRKPGTHEGWPVWKVGNRRYNGMRMIGLTKGINHNALGAGVVMHEAEYNKQNEKDKKNKRFLPMGRSFGCPAFVEDQGRKVMKEIKGGSLYYSYVPQCKADMKDILKDVEGWENVCAQ